jgi:hypothetical protein
MTSVSYLASLPSFGPSLSCLSTLLRFRGWFTFHPRIWVGPELGSAAAPPVSLWSYGIVFSSGLLCQLR